MMNNNTVFNEYKRKKLKSIPHWNRTSQYGQPRSAVVWKVKMAHAKAALVDVLIQWKHFLVDDPFLALLTWRTMIQVKTFLGRRSIPCTLNMTNNAWLPERKPRETKRKRKRRWRNQAERCTKRNTFGCHSMSYFPLNIKTNTHEKNEALDFLLFLTSLSQIADLLFFFINFTSQQSFCVPKKREREKKKEKEAQYIFQKRTWWFFFLSSKLELSHSLSRKLQLTKIKHNECQLPSPLNKT